LPRGSGRRKLYRAIHSRRFRLPASLYLDQGSFPLIPTIRSLDSCSVLLCSVPFPPPVWCSVESARPASLLCSTACTRIPISNLQSPFLPPSINQSVCRFMRRGVHAHVGRASETSGLRQVSSYRERARAEPNNKAVRRTGLFHS
jgi:hypothetical protein